MKLALGADQDFSDHWESLQPVPGIQDKSGTARAQGRSMFTLASVISGLIFVLLAGLNPWLMLTDRTSSAGKGLLWTRIHRTVGYVFIAIFTVTAHFMFLRLRGESDELPPRILLQMSLALMLAPC